MQNIYALYIGCPVKFVSNNQKGEAFLHGVVIGDNNNEVLKIRTYYPDKKNCEAYQDFEEGKDDVKLQLKDLAKLTRNNDDHDYLLKNFEIFITEPRHQILCKDLSLQNFSIEKLAAIIQFLAKQGYSLGLLPQKYYDIIP